MDRVVNPGAVGGRLLAGRYTLVEPLGDGATATIWRARDERLKRDVAVKVLRPEAAANGTTRARFEAEARAVATLNHPAIVPAFDVIVDGPTTAIVMALIPGESLAARIARTGPLPVGPAATILADIADALAHAHERGVVHCDVKPGNVLIDLEGHGHLADFGTASVRSASRSHRGIVEGTLHLLAPERLLGRPAQPSADVFALGATLFEALTGRPPWPATTPEELLRIQRAAPPPVAAAGPLAALVAACLATDPATRPTASQVASALRRFVGEPAQGLAGAPTARADTGRHRVVAPPRPVTPGRSRRRSVVAAGGFGGLAAAVAAAAFIGLPAFGGSPGASAARGSGAAKTARPTGVVAGAVVPGASVRRAAATPRPTPKPTPRPTAKPTPRPTAKPTPRPTHAAATPEPPLRVLFPSDGDFLEMDYVTVEGVAAPGSMVTHDVWFWPDDRTFADDSGRWTMDIGLRRGENVMVFRLGDNRDTEIELTVYAVSG